MEQQKLSDGSGPRRRGIVIGAIVAVVVILGAVIGYLAFNPTAPEGPGTSTPSPTMTATTEPTPTDSAPGEPAPTRTSAPPVPSPAVTPSRAPSASPSGLPPELEPADPAESVEGEDGMQVALTRIEQVQGEAIQPGEVAGPAIRVTVTLTNGSDRPVNTSFVVVNAFIGPELRPAATLVVPGGLAMEGTLPPGESTYGIYLFQVPPDERSDVTITVSYEPAVATVVFRGDVS